MPELICSRRDLAFLLYEWLDVERADRSAARYAEHSRETFDAVLDPAEQIATGPLRHRTTARATSTSRPSTASRCG